ncbi:hypothetical protein BXU11_16060 [Flavobacterium sp. LM5]|uniref:hypothetical protein n=1 Tax=Flavobacterium sp. LM5 TaxID=1938610 RepID=UPI000991F24D|nr:hypothetical protein [Flavobacterium sp. LM5]OOV25064.1 hypothetical protein BXU11_16060 [Flavobacterium sp. LM5]
MEITLHKLSVDTDSLPYDELIKAFTNFEFTNESYYTEEKIKGGGGYNCVEIKIIVENKNPNYGALRLIWEVSDKEISMEFFDAIVSTIKNISKDCNNSLVFRIVGGSYDIVDGSRRKFEYATFNAIAKLIDFK